MDDERIGRTIVVLRQKRGWRQRDLAARAAISESAISAMEHGRIDQFTLATVRRVLRALDASASLHVQWHGRGDLDRLLDGDHARLVMAWNARHLQAGWEVWNEPSYSIYGERGRIDQLSFHPGSGILEVAECKTGLWDNQETLGLLDVKLRLAPKIAAERGWQPSAVVGALVLADGRTVRRRLAQYAPLYARYALRGHAAHAWIRNPRAGVEGLLAFVSLPDSNQGGLRRAGQQRVRVRQAVASVAELQTPPLERPIRA
jgi:transcriptional regulator with XRE-family HTH domain